MIIYYDTEVFNELKDVTSTLLLSYFIGWKKETQFWQQNELSNILGIPKMTLNRKLNELKELGYIEFQAIGRNKGKKTKFMLTEKALKFIPTPSNKPQPIAKDNKPIANDEKDEKQFVKDYELYLQITNEMERNINYD